MAFGALKFLSLSYAIFTNATNSKPKWKDVQMESNLSTFQFEIQILHFLRVDQWHTLNLILLEWSVPE